MISYKQAEEIYNELLEEINFPSYGPKGPIKLIQELIEPILEKEKQEVIDAALEKAAQIALVSSGTMQFAVDKIRAQKGKPL